MDSNSVNIVGNGCWRSIFHRGKIEKDSVQTFQQQQDYVDLQILDILKDEMRDVERRLEQSPASIYLKNQYDKLKAKIKRMEDRLYD